LNPQITEYLTVTGNAEPLYLTTGPDGAIWFTENGSAANSVGRLDPSAAMPGTDAGMTEYVVPTASKFPFGISAGPDGAIWFTEGVANGDIGRVVIQTSAALRRVPRRPRLK
jgi:virginiamycin B lyase